MLLMFQKNAFTCGSLNKFWTPFSGEVFFLLLPCTLRGESTRPFKVVYWPFAVIPSNVLHELKIFCLFFLFEKEH